MNTIQINELIDSKIKIEKKAIETYLSYLDKCTNDDYQYYRTMFIIHQERLNILEDLKENNYEL